VINILNINGGKNNDMFDAMMSLPQHLTLGDDKRLRIEPVSALSTLRGEHQHIGETVLPADQEVVLKSVQGNVQELVVEIDPKGARWVQLNVLRSPAAEEQTSITFYNYATPAGPAMDGAIREEVVLDGSRSTTLPDVWLRAPEKTFLNRGGETLKLRVFIDRSVVEVFANGRQYLAMRVYPGRKDSLGVSLRARGDAALLKGLDAWQLKPIWPVAALKLQGSVSSAACVAS
jgi:beta-fructofuranosidase